VRGRGRWGRGRRDGSGGDWGGSVHQLQPAPVAKGGAGFQSAVA
jgi:hypothetical protein